NVSPVAGGTSNTACSTVKSTVKQQPSCPRSFCLAVVGGVIGTHVAATEAIALETAKIECAVESLVRLTRIRAAHSCHAAWTKEAAAATEAAAEAGATRTQGRQSAQPALQSGGAATRLAVHLLLLRQPARLDKALIVNLAGRNEWYGRLRGRLSAEARRAGTGKRRYVQDDDNRP